MTELNKAFEKVFPKVYERPGLYPFKDTIRKIVLDTIEELQSNAEFDTTTRRY